MPLLSEIPWKPARPERKWGRWAIVVAAGFIMVLALFSRGVLPEPEVQQAKPSAVMSTSEIERRPLEAAAPIAKSSEPPPVREPSRYDGLRRELLEGR